MTPEEWSAISAGWRHVKLEPALASGAFIEQPHVTTHHGRKMYSWDEDVYNVPSLIYTYEVEWRKAGYRIPCQRLNSQQTT